VVGVFGWGHRYRACVVSGVVYHNSTDNSSVSLASLAQTAAGLDPGDNACCVQYLQNLSRTDVYELVKRPRWVQHQGKLPIAAPPLLTSVLVVAPVFPKVSALFGSTA
jgi:hypothetical protein